MSVVRSKRQDCLDKPEMSVFRTAEASVVGLTMLRAVILIGKRPVSPSQQNGCTKVICVPRTTYHVSKSSSEPAHSQPTRGSEHCRDGVPVYKEALGLVYLYRKGSPSRRSLVDARLSKRNGTVLTCLVPAPGSLKLPSSRRLTSICRLWRQAMLGATCQ